MNNQIRIIAGEWRSRQIRFSDQAGLRPTPGRIRETLFNWLQYDTQGSHCLDWYAGSGALGFEAASRGAKQVVMVENQPQACQDIRQNMDQLNASQIHLIAQDADQYLAQNHTQFDLVFIDPPFRKEMAINSACLLEQHQCLLPAAKIYLEVEAGNELKGLPENWQLLKTKKAGDVLSCLYQRA